MRDMKKVIRLVKRNFIATIDTAFLIWQIFFPLLYLFIAGYAYASIIEGVELADKKIEYPAFIASGIIGLNIMNSSVTAGSMIWNDKRTGMFEQILMLPFTRMDYVMSNIITIIIIGIISAGIVIFASIPTVFNGIEISLSSIQFLLLAILLGSIFFGSIAIIASIKFKSNEGFQTMLNTTFIFFAFVSTTFYPAEGAPEPLSIAFHINPLTYVVNIIRAGLFNSIYDFLYIEIIILTIISIITFTVATRLLVRLNV